MVLSVLAYFNVLPYTVTYALKGVPKSVPKSGPKSVPRLVSIDWGLDKW